MAAPNHILRLGTPDNEDLGAFDHDLNFEGDAMLDDVHAQMPAIAFTPSYEFSDGLSTTFEDPFSYQSGPFESLLEGNPQNNTETSTNDLDTKLLGFGAPIMKSTILDDRGQTWPTMSAELYGMFFVAEDVFAGENTGRPMELTCYRRNLFQISGTITLSRSIANILNEQGKPVPIYELSATLSAIESIEGKATEIISVPWKTANAPPSSEDKAGASPPKWPLDLSMNPELDPLCVTLPIAWKRLQFKHATANNGRRKGLQQHYVVQINLMATLATGETVKLAEIQSGPIIVRGRSPRNFDSRKDIPLNEKKSEPKQRTMSDSSNTGVKMDPAAVVSSYKYYTQNPMQQPLDLPEWKTNNHSSTTPTHSVDANSQRPSKKQSITSPTHRRPPVPNRWKSSENLSKGSTNGPVSAPIDLSLMDDDSSTKSNQSQYGSRSLSIGDNSPPTSGASKKNANSPIESADLLYEYFPLSLDDWMPPVDAIYRPHVVHHTIIPEDMKAQQLKSKAKRYFSAED
ncbi:hypothetical protein F5884DRAFT_674893 [Xylogone sp. PMI_703]|nr:hypothetical protein F5884DRAFT_674893 [Xylogone sp. PMI_703]